MNMGELQLYCTVGLERVNLELNQIFSTDFDEIFMTNTSYCSSDFPKVSAF